MASTGITFGKPRRYERVGDVVFYDGLIFFSARKETTNMDKLKGYRTYILAAVGALLTAMQLLGVIDLETYGTLMGLVGAGGLATLRAAVPK